MDLGELREYKGIIMAALKEASWYNLLGSIGDKEAYSLYHKLKYEEYCEKIGKKYEDLTEEDWEQIALMATEKEEKE